MQFQTKGSPYLLIVCSSDQKWMPKEFTNRAGTWEYFAQTPDSLQLRDDQS